MLSTAENAETTSALPHTTPFLPVSSSSALLLPFSFLLLTLLHFLSLSLSPEAENAELKSLLDKLQADKEALAAKPGSKHGSRTNSRPSSRKKKVRAIEMLHFWPIVSRSALPSRLLLAVHVVPPVVVPPVVVPPSLQSSRCSLVSHTARA